MTSVPSSDVDKDVKYDRQLRLWGEHGQEKLEKAHICLLNATSTGTEILKSLVLPSVGSFTIIDGNIVTGADAGSNFFVDRESIGEPRAKIACDLLKELNPDVTGFYIAEYVETIIQKDLKSLNDFSLVIGTGLIESTMREVAQYLLKCGIPFLVARSYGLFGSIRVQISEHAIVESHPENEFPDLRLDCPFSELTDFILSEDLSSMNHQQHSHTPYIVLYFKALEKFRAKSGTSFPSSYADKKVFREILRDMRMPDDKGSLDEENFAEAVNALNKSLCTTRINPDVAKILQDPACNEKLTQSSSHFWVVCKALNQFVKQDGNEKRLPLRGTLPDMISDSGRYVKLQTLFHDRALADAKKVFSYVQDVLKSLSLPLDTIDFSYVQRFCRNAAFIRLLRCRSLDQEYSDKAHMKEIISSGLQASDKQMSIYVLFRAVDLFKKELDRYPGANGIPVDLDQVDLLKRVNRFLQDLGVSEKIDSDLLTEMCRFGASELHATAAFIGGIAAQEATKILTQQYVPLNNTFIFNGVTAEGTTFEF